LAGVIITLLVYRIGSGWWQ